MKKVIIALTAIVAMASCKKENVTTAITPTTAVTKSLTKSTYAYDNGTPDTYSYTYDAQGRIATIKDDIRTETFNFISATSLVSTERNSTDNNLIATRECTVNEKWYITKIVVKNPAAVTNGTYDYIYNADGFMTNEKLTYPGGSTSETVYIIADGNVVSSKLYNNNILIANREFAYDNTKVDKTQLNVSSYWSVPNLFGKGAKSMRVDFKSFNTSGTLTFQAQYTYELDATGYPTKRTTNFPLLGKQGVNTFTYQ